MIFELPKLPYSNDSLSPFVSGETLEFHHGKHHAAYVNKLNELLKGSGESKFRDMSLEQIITSAGRGPIFNNAAQHWNHSFYWNCMTPKETKPAGALASAITQSFGTLESMKKQFNEAAVGHFGSGWAWLVFDNGKIKIETTHDADLPLAHGGVAIFTCDVWEHAYYVDYRNARPKYLEAFWNIVNWDFVAANFEQCAEQADRAHNGHPTHP